MYSSVYGNVHHHQTIKCCAHEKDDFTVVIVYVFTFQIEKMIKGTSNIGTWIVGENRDFIDKFGEDGLKPASGDTLYVQKGNNDIEQSLDSGLEDNNSVTCSKSSDLELVDSLHISGNLNPHSQNNQEIVTDKNCNANYTAESLSDGVCTKQSDFSVDRDVKVARKLKVEECDSTEHVDKRSRVETAGAGDGEDVGGMEFCKDRTADLDQNTGTLTTDSEKCTDSISQSDSQSENVQDVTSSYDTVSSNLDNVNTQENCVSVRNTGPCTAVKSTNSDGVTTLDAPLKRGYDPCLMSVDRHCDMCRNVYLDPNPHELGLFLHAVKYTVSFS